MKKMMILISMVTLISNHPMTMGLMLITQTTLTCMIITETLLYPWYSYMLFLSIVSGLMIMFIYMASIMSNQKFKMKFKLMLIALIIMMLTENFLTKSSETMYKIISNKMLTMKNENLKTTIKFFNLYKSTLTLISMLILFMLLITISNIVPKNEGPLKKTYV